MVTMTAATRIEFTRQETDALKSVGRRAAWLLGIDVDDGRQEALLAAVEIIREHGDAYRGGALVRCVHLRLCGRKSNSRMWRHRAIRWERPGDLDSAGAA